MPDVESLEQDRRYSLLLIIIGSGAILYGTLALLTQASASPLLLFDPILGAALVAAGLFWGPLAHRREGVPKVAVGLPQPHAGEDASPPASPPPGAHMEPPPIWLEDLEPPLADTGATFATPGSDGVLLEIEKIRVDAGRRKAVPSTSGADETT